MTQEGGSRYNQQNRQKLISGPGNIRPDAQNLSSSAFNTVFGLFNNPKDQKQDAISQNDLIVQ